MTDVPLKPPPAINFARVLEYALLDQWQGDTAGAASAAEGEGVATVACLAIGQRARGAGASLFHCNRDWKVLGIAPCASLLRPSIWQSASIPAYLPVGLTLRSAKKM